MMEVIQKRSKDPESVKESKNGNSKTIETPPRKIYAITCFTKLEENNTWPAFGSMTFMGWYAEKDIAIESVKINAADINETCYDYAVVEEVEEGLYAFPRKRWLFRFDEENGKYVEIEEPKFMKCIANIL